MTALSKNLISSKALLLQASRAAITQMATFGKTTFNAAKYASCELRPSPLPSLFATSSRVIVFLVLQVDRRILGSCMTLSSSITARRKELVGTQLWTWDAVPVRMFAGASWSI